MSSNNINFFTFNNEHSWENLSIKLRNQQTYTFNNHNQSKGGPVFAYISSQFCKCNTSIVMYISNRQKLENMRRNQITPTYLGAQGTANLYKGRQCVRYPHLHCLLQRCEPALSVLVLNSPGRKRTRCLSFTTKCWVKLQPVLSIY